VDVYNSIEAEVREKLHTRRRKNKALKAESVSEVQVLKRFILVPAFNFWESFFKRYIPIFIGCEVPWETTEALRK